MNTKDPNPMHQHRRIYEKLNTIIPDLEKHIQRGVYYGKSHLDSPGMMDLSFDYAGKDKDGNHLIALSHYFEMNGDMVPDPDMEIRLFPKEQLAEALSFQNQFLYQRVYELDQGKTYVRPKLKRDLNDFLEQWLTNCIAQGHCIDLSREKKKELLDRDRELKQSRENNPGGEDRAMER